MTNNLPRNRAAAFAARIEAPYRCDTAEAIVRVARHLPCPFCARELKATDIVFVDGGFCVRCAGCHHAAIEIEAP